MKFGGTQSPTHYKEHNYLQGHSSPAPQKSRKKNSKESDYQFTINYLHVEWRK